MGRMIAAMRNKNCAMDIFWKSKSCKFWRSVQLRIS